MLISHNDAESGSEKDDERGGPYPSWLVPTLICLLAVLGVAVVGLCVALAVVMSGKDETPSKSTTSLWGCYTLAFEKARYIDLTHAIVPGMPVWEAFSSPVVKEGKAGARVPDFVEVGEPFSYAKHGFITTSYALAADQLGTQLDPPSHWNELGATISDIPATVALRPLVVVDLHDKVLAQPNYTATRADCEAWEAANQMPIPAGSVVFFRTDWGRSWPNTSAVIPSVGLDALKFLHNERHILVHGHEPLDTDSTPNLEGEAWLMHNNFMQVEGVTNLHLVAEQGCLVSIGFAKMFHGSGGYARFVAICPATHPLGTTIAQASAAPLPQQTAPLRRDANGVLQPTPGAAPTKYCELSSALGCADGELVG